MEYCHNNIIVLSGVKLSTFVTPHHLRSQPPTHNYYNNIYIQTLTRDTLYDCVGSVIQSHNVGNKRCHMSKVKFLRMLQCAIKEELLQYKGKVDFLNKILLNIQKIKPKE